jgi:hypothetical protein
MMFQPFHLTLSCILVSVPKKTPAGRAEFDRGNGVEPVRTRCHLHECADGYDGFVLRGDALMREHERLPRRGGDALRSIGLDVADAVEEQRQDGDGGEHHQPRPNAERELGSTRLGVLPSASVQHGALQNPLPRLRSGIDLRKLSSKHRNSRACRSYKIFRAAAAAALRLYGDHPFNCDDIMGS